MPSWKMVCKELPFESPLERGTVLHRAGHSLEDAQRKLLILRVLEDNQYVCLQMNADGARSITKRSVARAYWHIEVPNEVE